MLSPRVDPNLVASLGTCPIYLFLLVISTAYVDRRIHLPELALQPNRLHQLNMLAMLRLTNNPNQVQMHLLFDEARCFQQASYDLLYLILHYYLLWIVRFSLALIWAYCRTCGYENLLAHHR